MISATTNLCHIFAVILVAPLPLVVKTAPINVFDQGDDQRCIVHDPEEPRLSKGAKPLQALPNTTIAAAALSDGTCMDIAASAPATVVTGTYGTGDLVVFGDGAVFQKRFPKDDNRKLATKPATWLTRR